MHLSTLASILGSLAAVVALAAPPEIPNDGIPTNINTTTHSSSDWGEPLWTGTGCSPHDHESFNPSNPDVGNIIAKWNDLCENKDLRVGHLHGWSSGKWVYFKSGNHMFYMCNPERWDALPCKGHNLDKILAEIDRACGTQHGGWVNLKRFDNTWLKMSYYSIGRDPFKFTDGNRILECGFGNDGIDAETCVPNQYGYLICD